MTLSRKSTTCAMILLTATAMNAQKYIQLTSSDSQQWMQSGAVRAESAPVFTERVSSDDRNPIVEFGHWEGKHVVVTGNLSDTEKEISVKAGERFLNVTLAPHTFHSFVEK